MSPLPLGEGEGVHAGVRNRAPTPSGQRDSFSGYEPGRTAVSLTKSQIRILTRWEYPSEGSDEHRSGPPNSQSDQDPAVQLWAPAYAGVPHELDGLLPRLLRLVRHCADDGHRPRRPATYQGRDRQHRHRLGGGDHRGPAGGGLALRSHRPPHHLFGVADCRLIPGDDHRVGQQLRVFSAVQTGHRHHRRLLHHHAVPHLGNVCSQRGGNGQRHHRRMGQPGRWRNADGDAAGAGRHRGLGRCRRHRVAHRHGGAGRGAA